MTTAKISEKNDITVRIMERDFSVKCPADKVADLHKAAKYLDTKIHEFHESNNKVINIDDLVVITALNVAHELLTQKKQNNLYIDNMKQQINSIQGAIERALASEK